MTLIMPNTPLYRDDTYACDGIIDPFIMDLSTNNPFVIPLREYEGRNYYVQITNGLDVYYPDFDRVDIIGNNQLIEFYSDTPLMLIVYKEDGEIIEINPNNIKWTINLISAERDEDAFINVEFKEFLGYLIFVDDSCGYIQINYNVIDCNVGSYDFKYFLKGRLSMQPAISDENVSFLGTNGQTNTLFSIVHQPLMLTTSVMGWREHQFLTNILNSKNVKINGQTMNRVDGSFYTVRDASTKGKVGTMLFILATTIFTSCCKEYQPEPTNYIVENIDLDGQYVDLIFGNFNTSVKDADAWVSSMGDGIDIYFAMSHVNLSSTEIISASLETASYYITPGDLLASLIKNKIESSSVANKPIMTINNRTLRFEFNSITTNFHFYAHNKSYVGSLSDLATAESNNSIDTNVTDEDLEIDVFLGGDLTFFINKNGNWENVTYQIFNNTWKVLNSTDIITKYQIRKNDGITVLLEGDVSTF